MKLILSIILAKAIALQEAQTVDEAEDWQETDQTIGNLPDHYQAYESDAYTDEYGDYEDLNTLGRSQGNRRVGGRRRMVKHLTIKDWRDFSDYGCWCIEKKGYGAVVDSVDFACMTHSKCWGCAKAENGKECEGSSTSYKWKFVKDRTTKTVIDIKCLNKEGTCEKDICECDKQLVFNLRDVESVYDSKFKQTKANKDTMCQKASAGGDASSEKSLQPAASGPLDSCCGDEVFKFPFATMGGARACCGTRTYDTTVLECCSQEESDIRSIGSCSL